MVPSSSLLIASCLSCKLNLIFLSFFFFAAYLVCLTKKVRGNVRRAKRAGVCVWVCYSSATSGFAHIAVAPGDEK